MSICFAILSHADPESLEDLLANLRYFNPGCFPLVYNASGSDRLFRHTSAPIYPQSTQLQYGLGTEYILDLMSWSLDEGYEYDFFVVLDNDMLFINGGLEAFLRQRMASSEYLGVEFHSEPDPSIRWRPRTDILAWWQPIQMMWPEWETWRPLLGATHPFGVFNPGQTFRKSLVRRIVTHPHIKQIRAEAGVSSIVGLAEILFPTLAVTLGGNPQAYPRETYAEAIHVQFTHWGKESLSLREVRRLETQRDCYFIHPVKPLTVDHPIRQYLREGRYKGNDLSQTGRSRRTASRRARSRRRRRSGH